MIDQAGSSPMAQRPEEETIPSLLPSVFPTVEGEFFGPVEVLSSTRDMSSLLDTATVLRSLLSR